MTDGDYEGDEDYDELFNYAMMDYDDIDEDDDNDDQNSLVAFKDRKV